MPRPLAALLLPAALLALLSGGPAAAVEAVSEAEHVMRIGPGDAHRPIATVPAGARLIVHGCVEAEGWCLVRFDGRRGWLPGEDLAFAGFARKPAPAHPAAAPAMVKVITEEVILAPRRFVTADDVIVGMGERFGLAAIAPRPPKAAFRKLGARSHKRFHPDRAHVRKFGDHGGRRHHADRAHVRKAGVHFGKRFHADRAHVRKRLGGDRIHFGKHGLQLKQRPKVRHGLDFGRPFAGKRSQFRHGGTIRTVGLRMKGGWRP